MKGVQILIFPLALRCRFLGYMIINSLSRVKKNKNFFDGNDYYLLNPVNEPHPNPLFSHVWTKSDSTIHA